MQRPENRFMYGFYNMIPREELSWVLEKKRVYSKYIDVIKDMYYKTITKMRTTEEREL